MVLRKPAKHEKIVADVTAAIRKGDLRPGDRLLPFTELCRRYGVTQFVVAKALDELEQALMVVREHRRGVFVAQAAAGGVCPGAGSQTGPESKSGVSGESAQPDISARHAVLTSMLQFNPHGSEANITVFVTDGYPEQLALWRAVLDEFEQENTRCRVNLDHVQEDYADSWHRAAGADVVVATPPMLRSFGSDHLLPIEDLSVFGVEFSALLARVAQYAEQRSPLAGVPFALVPNLLYLNSEEARRIQVAGLPQDSLTRFLKCLANRMRRLPAEERLPLNCGGLFSLLTLDGALSLAPDLTIMLNSARARRVLEVAHELLDLTGSVPAGSWDALCSQRPTMAGVASGLYLSLFLKGHARVAWQARSLPANPGATGPEMPMLCCGIRRDTAWLPECMGLVHHLCRDRSQHRLASLGHCVPVLQATAFAADTARSYPIHARDMKRVVDQGSLCWAETAENQMFIGQMQRLGLDAEQAGYPVVQTLRLLETLHRQYVERAKGGTAEPAIADSLAHR